MYFSSMMFFKKFVFLGQVVKSCSWFRGGERYGDDFGPRSESTQPVTESDILLSDLLSDLLSVK